MEVLSVKAGIFASLFGVLGIIGLAVLLVSVFWLVIRVANFDSVLPALLCVVLSIGLMAGGLMSSPTPDYSPEPLRMPWETLLDWVVSLRDRKEESEAPSGEDAQAAPEGDAAAPEGDPAAQPEMETMDVVYHTIPAEGAAPTASLSGNPAESGGITPAAASVEADRVLLDQVISGWRVRMTLPRAWKDSCVVESNGTNLSFYQKASRQGYGGLVFFLVVMPSPVDFDSPEYWHMDGPQIVVEKDGAALISAGPADVQFNYEVQEIFEEYSRMQAAIPGILSTVEFERA